MDSLREMLCSWITCMNGGKSACLVEVEVKGKDNYEEWHTLQRHEIDLAKADGIDEVESLIKRTMNDMGRFSADIVEIRFNIRKIQENQEDQILEKNMRIKFKI